MNIKLSLKYIYHVCIKRDIIGPFKMKKYGNIGKNVLLYKPGYIDKHKKNIEIGNNTTICSGARLQTFPELTGNNSKIIIGNNCYLGYRLSILAGADVIIEDGVLIASDVLISSENHSMNPESRLYYMNQRLSCKPIVIGEGSWIGEKVCILPGVKIGTKCVIGAGSIVTKSIPDYCIAVGNPARVIKRYNFKNHCWENINKGEDE